MTHRLRLNPIACEAHGMCAELLPEQIVLDEWGYPVLGEEMISPEIMSHAKRAAQACPTFALRLEATHPSEDSRQMHKQGTSID
jgi:ferredoxin